MMPEWVLPNMLPPGARPRDLGLQEPRVRGQTTECPSMGTGGRGEGPGC